MIGRRERSTEPGTGSAQPVSRRLEPRLGAVCGAARISSHTPAGDRSTVCGAIGADDVPMDEGQPLQRLGRRDETAADQDYRLSRRNSWAVATGDAGQRVVRSYARSGEPRLEPPHSDSIKCGRDTSHLSSWRPCLPQTSHVRPQTAGVPGRQTIRQPDAR